MLEIDLSLKRFGERRHLFADQQGELHSGCDERSGKALVIGFAARSQFLHRTKNHDPAVGGFDTELTERILEELYFDEPPMGMPKHSPS